MHKDTNSQNGKVLNIFYEIRRQSLKREKERLLLERFTYTHSYKIEHVTMES